MSLFRGYRRLNTATLPLNRGLRPHIVPVQMADSSGKPSKMPSDSRYRMPCITIMTISRAIVFLKGGMANDLNGEFWDKLLSYFAELMLIMLSEYTYFLADEPFSRGFWMNVGETFIW